LIIFVKNDNLRYNAFSMVEIVDNGPPSPVESALKEGRPITIEMEQKTFGPAYQYMRTAGLTPLGVRDSAQKWVQWHSEGAITGERVEMLPTAEQAQTIMDSIDAGRYAEALNILEEKDTVLENLVVQEEKVVKKKIATYEEQHPEVVAEYERLSKQRIQFARAGTSATKVIAEKVRNHPFRQFQEETSRRLNSLKQQKSRYGSCIKTLKGETID